jgi:hypothetical protein
MPIRIFFSAIALVAGVASAVAGWNEDMVPLKSRVAIGARGHLTQKTLACPEPGLLRMALSGKDHVRAASKIRWMGLL